MIGNDIASDKPTFQRETRTSTVLPVHFSLHFSHHLPDFHKYYPEAQLVGLSKIMAHWPYNHIWFYDSLKNWRKIQNLIFDKEIEKSSWVKWVYKRSHWKITSVICLSNFFLLFWCNILCSFALNKKATWKWDLFVVIFDQYSYYAADLMRDAKQ